MGEQKPSVGRIVHYVEKQGEDNCSAAIIVELDNVTDTIQEVSLVIFNQGGMIFLPNVRYSELGADDTWHWPERV